MADYDMEGQLAQLRLKQAYDNQQQAQQPSQGRMAGQVYLTGNPIAQALRVYQAGKDVEGATQQLQGIGQQRQEAQGRDMSAFVQALRGTPAQPAFEAAGPAPQGAPQEGGYTVPAQAAKAGDPYAAYSLASSSQSPMVRQMGMQGMAQLPQLEQAKAEKEANRTFQAEQKDLDRQARQDQIRMQLQGQQEMRQLMAGQKQAQIIQTEQGPMQLVNGRAVPIMGADNMPVKGAVTEKPLNEAQANATMYGLRMEEANKILKDLESKGETDTGLLRTGLGGVVGAVPLVGDSLRGGVDNVANVLPSALGGLSSAQQQNKQARSNFITAVLRKESGAAIGKDEFDREEAKYFPQAGDSKETIKQKQDARNLAIQAMKIGAGPGASKIGGGTNAPTSSGW